MNIIDKIRKTLRDPKYKPRNYIITANGSTVMAKDKEAARQKAQDIARKRYEQSKRY